MKKHLIMSMMFAAVLSLAACGGSSVSKDESETSSIISSIIKEEDPIVVSTSTTTSTSDVADPEPDTNTTASTEKEDEDATVDTDKMYRSELTNEWISKDIQNQRPVAIMVDNESVALPHYGTSDADIVYEMVNSTANNRITRLMCIIKDWKNIERFGNVRSTRPTNILIAPEYNAVLVHDGGPYYNNTFFAEKIAKQHLSGGFARFTTGKKDFYSEYVTAQTYKNPDTGKSYSGLIARMDKAGYTEEYNKNYLGEHFTFAKTDLSEAKSSKVAETIKIPFPKNKSTLTYDSETKTYVYSEYDKEYYDALYGDENRRMEFKNVFLINCKIEQLDEHGYMAYYLLGSGEGYFITEGYAVPIKWEKKTINDLMTFKDKNGKDITLNTGKTYFAIVPTDNWSGLKME